MKNIIYLSSLVLSLGGAYALADEAADSQKRDAVVEKREQLQEQRIEQGEKSGALTPKEAQHLEKKEARVKAAEQKAMADGDMSKREFKKIEKMQNRDSRKIYREKHNRRHE